MLYGVRKALMGKQQAYRAFFRSANMERRARAGHRAAWLLVLPLALHMQVSFAQDTGPAGPPDAAGTRPQPEYDPLGIRVGAVDIYPTATVSGSYTSNIFAAPDNTQSDLYYTLTPAIRVTTSNDRRTLNLNGSARIRRYDKFDTQNDEQYFINASGRLNIGAYDSVQATAGWSQATAARGTYQNTLQQGSPLREERFNGALVGDYRFNRLRLNARVGGEKFNYDDIVLDDGTIIDQDYRDGNRINGSLAAYYSISSRFSLRLQGSVEKFNYQDPDPIRNRDATGYSVTAGGLYEVTELFSAELGVGYRRHNFKNPQFKDIPGFALNGRLRWYPTPLVSVRLDLSQTTDTSTLPLVTAVNVSSATLAADYELRRNVLLTGRLDFSHEHYGGVDANSNLMSASVRSTWKATRWLRVGGELAYDRRTSADSAPISEFDAFRAMLSLTLAR
jgi:hypothetical protein